MDKNYISIKGAMPTRRQHSDNHGLLAIGVVGGCLTAITILAAPFLLIPASKRLGSLPWMVRSVSVDYADRISYFIPILNA